MAGRTWVPFIRAVQYADQFVTLIRDACVRVEVSGEVRRRQERVSEITVLAIPVVMEMRDMFGDLRETRDMLAETMERLLKAERIVKTASGFWGPAQRDMQFRTARGALMAVTLLTSSPERWGLDLAVSTGPSSLALAFTARQGTVTTRGRAGLLPPEYRVWEGLKTWEGGEDIPTPEEADFLRLVYGEDIPPPERRR
jgi:hypothetical protein